jgi:predicted esterase YcpF (UPF0227 family)
MATIIYIHGFLSSPLSAKAQQVKAWLSQHRPDISYICPQLPPYPNKCADILEGCMVNADSPVYLMGSSMGGFWATWLVEKYGCKALLVNPAVDVFRLMPAYINQQLANYHIDEHYCLTAEHLDQLRSYHVETPQKCSNYWLLVQTGDETLDYSLAVEKYSACRQTIEQGGDHSFQGFDRFIPQAINFFESTK